MTTKTAYVMTGAGYLDVGNMLRGMGLLVKLISKVEQLPKVDIEPGHLLVLTGGTDVNPALYGCNAEPYQRYDDLRDREENAAIDWAVENHVPVLGICRGSQLLCVNPHVGDGQLVQDVGGHTLNHTMFFKGADGRERGILINSTHHQVCIPDRRYGSVIGWAANHYESQPPGFYTHTGTRYNECHCLPTLVEGNDYYQSPEIVYYKDKSFLGIQYHPEWMAVDSGGREVAVNLIKQLTSGKVVDIGKAHDDWMYINK